MSLDDPQVRALSALINDSFRVRKNQRPVYVDVGTHLSRIRAKQHQVIFGRRGSGKSCLLIHFMNEARSDTSVIPVYILADEFKRLTYPDVLIRLLIEILEGFPIKWRRVKHFFRRPIPTLQHAKDLRALLDLADESGVVERRENASAEESAVEVTAPGVGRLGASSGESQKSARTSSFKERKLDIIERHLKEYKSALEQATKGSPGRHACVLIDDFYLLPPERQPDVLDYLHRLLRDTDLYLKVATVRHRTVLSRNHPHTIGIEISQDIEALDLDRTLEDLDATQSYLAKMLNSLGEKVGIKKVTEELFNPEAMEALTLAAGGVPRDCLTILNFAIEEGLARRSLRWVTPTLVYKGASRLAWQTKLKGLRDDATSDADGLERLFTDLTHFCLREAKKTAFLISQEEAQRMPAVFERIQQLMDFKLIHVVEPDTSAASGRSGRYAAYTLDFSFFMEPRRRGIEVVEFWKIDDQRRRTGIREAPLYPLTRASEAFDDASKPQDPSEILKPEGELTDSGDAE
jgi:hypothetical protein